MMANTAVLPDWIDFPRGLQVMVVEQDLDVIKDVQAKLHACGYLVTCYRKGNEALEALKDKNKSFHVVVVDATRCESFDGFKIAAAAKHLTTIMMASTENMNIMMQGIAAGASEFLQKPLSEEKLRNIWQHVVRKALVTGHLAGPIVSSAHIDVGPAPLASILCTENDDDDPLVSTVKQDEEAGCKYVYTCTQQAVLDELPNTHEFLFQEDQDNHQSNSYFDMDEKDNCDAFLCSTPPQLEQSCTRILPMDHEDNRELASSPILSASQGFRIGCMKREINDGQECFDDCDNYLQIKSEVEEAVNNSAILNELFNSKSKLDPDHLLLAGDDRSIRSAQFCNPGKLCADLQFDDIPDGLDDITLSGDLLDDNAEQSLSIGLDCLDDEDFPEADEEALLLAEVAKADKGVFFKHHMHNAGAPNHNNSNVNSSSIATNFVSNGSKSDLEAEETRSKSDSEQSCNIKRSKNSNGKKKMKVDWTLELHRRFVQAVEQLGVDKAIPSRILELMGVKCLTRHNIASHLQKYRSQRKHLLAREAEAASWNQRRQMEAAATRKAPPALHACRPPAHQTQPRAVLPSPPLHVWGHPTVEHAMQFWPGPTWPPPACQVDAWGNYAFYPAQPILRVPLAPMPSLANVQVVPPPCGKLAISALHSVRFLFLCLLFLGLRGIHIRTHQTNGSTIIG